MELIFPYTLKQPEKYQYLWRYIKPTRIDDFVNGKLFFPTLRDFEDYYEGITPLHLFILSYIRQMMTLDLDVQHEKTPIFQFPTGDMITAHFSDRILLRQLRLLTDINEEEKIREIVKETVDKHSEMHAKHRQYQSETRCSCWFVGGEEESALMWKTYSEEGGIAVRIRADNFIGKFETLSKVGKDMKIDLGIDRIYFGLVEYHHYQLDEDWIHRFKNGVPLAFFKHNSFKYENEFRLIYHASGENLIQEISPFGLLTDFTVVLHPNTSAEQMLNLSNQFRKKGAIVRPSQMWWPKK
ncbi:MAG: hypothetical protein K9G41_11515 [Flavobacteriales bacterium]|nr:hypothetical protein [Flavobacteriales bacterium]